MMYSPPRTGQPASAPPDVRDYSELELHAKAFRLCGVQLKLSSTALVSPLEAPSFLVKHLSRKP